MKKYPKTEKYDPAWVSENWMGPNPLWLLEELCEHMYLKPGMKVLDMGCGKGLTSVFLAKEYGVTVFANDLWISATDNLKRLNPGVVLSVALTLISKATTRSYALKLTIMMPFYRVLTAWNLSTRRLSTHGGSAVFVSTTPTDILSRSGKP